MKILPVLLTITQLVGCGAPRQIDPELQEYVDTILESCEYDNCRLNNYIEYIGFGDTKGHHGYCDVQIGTFKDIQLPITRNIYINRESWNKFNEGQRLSLIAHELGHCNWFQDDQKNAYNLMDPDHHSQINEDDQLATFTDYYAEVLEGRVLHSSN